MKYLMLLLLILLTACSNSNNIRIGMTVTNGHCIGVVTAIRNKKEEATLANVMCENVYTTHIYEKIQNLKEVK